MNKPRISIVLGSYNRKPFLVSTITCIRKNGITIPYEIIVVDGGSTDGSLEYLLEQKDVITIVQHNQSEEKKSWGYFMNLGFKIAQGKYILMISDDALLVPGATMNGYNYFEEKLKSGEKLGALAFYFRNYPGDKEYFVASALGQMYVNHGMYLKKALTEINYLDEDNLFFYHGDADVCLRLAEKGYKTLDCKNAFVEHFKHTGKSHRLTNQEKHAAAWKYFKKRWVDLINNPEELTEKNINQKHYLTFKDTTDTARYFRKTFAYRKYKLYLLLLKIKRKIWS